MALLIVAPSSELENKGMLAGIEKVGGTSAGAITALCISLGIFSQLKSQIFYIQPNFQKFNDGRFFFPVVLTG